MESHKWHSVLPLMLKLIMAVLAVMTLLKGQYVWFIGIIFVLFLTLIPSILAKDFHVKLPIIFDLTITISIFLHTIGGYVNWYDNIKYYDHLTHFFSSTTVSLIGVTLLYIIVYFLKVARLPPFFFGLFTVLFAISMGVAWEFLEWIFDSMLGTDLQRGLQDTMWDFAFDTVAGIVIGAIATIQLKRGKGAQVTEIEFGDIASSTGYKRWQLLTDKDIALKEKIKISFKDPVLLDGFFDYIVKESKHISNSEMKIWNKMKKKIKRR